MPYNDSVAGLWQQRTLTREKELRDEYRKAARAHATEELYHISLAGAVTTRVEMARDDR